MENSKINTWIKKLRKELDREILYHGDMSDFGNEIGYSLGRVIKNMTQEQINDFISGLQHGISLTNNTH